MKKHYFSLFSFVLILSVLFSSFTVYADVGRDPGGYYEHPEGHFHSQEELNRWHLYNFERICGKAGCIINGNAHEAVIDYLQREKNFSEGRTPYSWLYDNITVSYNSSDEPYVIGFSDEYLSTICEFIEWYKADADSKQVFTWVTSNRPVDILYASSFSSMDSWNYMKSKLEALCNQYDYVYVTAWSDGGNNIAVCDCYTVSQLGIVNKYPYVNWERPSVAAKIGSDDPLKAPCSLIFTNERREYKFNSHKELMNSSAEGLYGPGSGGIMFFTGGTHTVNHMDGIVPFYGESLPWGQTFKGNYLLTHDRGYIRNFKTLDDLKNFQSGTWQPPYATCEPTLSGNTITAQQLNDGVNYGDIIGGNKIIIGPGYPVDPGYQPVQPGPGSGGGGGGNIGQPDPDSGWNIPIPDFTGFFKIIGELIVSILSGIVELLKTVLEYLSSAITDLFKLINQIIQSLLSLTQGTFFNFLKQFLAFLPPEITSLITLSITLMVVFGIVKLIRG